MMTYDELTATRDRHNSDQDSWDVKKVPDYGGSWTYHMANYLKLAVENLGLDDAKKWLHINFWTICESWGCYTKVNRVFDPVYDAFGSEFVAELRQTMQERKPDNREHLKYWRYL